MKYKEGLVNHGFRPDGVVDFPEIDNHLTNSPRFPDSQFNTDKSVDIEYPIELDLRLKDALTSLVGDPPELPQEDVRILISWVLYLQKNFKRLSTSRLISYPEESFFNGLQEFITNPDHGIYHSLMVYRGMQYLALMDGVEVNEQEMQFLALLHDITQGFDQFSIISRNLMNIEGAKKHGKAIGIVVKLIGSHFNFSKEKIKELYWALRDHDNGYNSRTMHGERYTYLAAILHDADKLFGASLDRNPESMVRTSIERNWIGNRGPNGSYLFRDLDEDNLGIDENGEEITPWDYRLRFTYGDRLYNDCATVVMYELLGMPFFSTSGRACAEPRRPIAKGIVLEVYAKIFDEVQEALDLWFSQKGELEIVGKTYKAKPLDKGLIFSDDHENTKHNMVDLVEYLYAQPIELPKMYHRKAYEEDDARGWKLRLRYPDGGSYVLDPSVARFCMRTNGREEFLTKLAELFDNAPEMHKGKREKLEAGIAC